MNATRVLLVLAALVAARPATAAGGRLVLADTAAHRVTVVSAAGVPLAQIPTGVGPRGMTVHGGLLYVADGGTERAPGSSVTVIDLARLAALRTLAPCEGCAPRDLAFDERGSLWIAALVPPALIEARPPYLHATRSTALDVAPVRLVAAGGTRLALGATAGTGLTVFDTASRVTSAVDLGAAAALVAARPHSAEVWCALAPAGRLAINGAPGTAPRTLAVPAFPQDLAFTPDGRLALLTAARDRVLLVLDATTGRELGRTVFTSAPRDLAPAPDGTAVAVFLPEEERVAIVALGDGRTPRVAAGFAVEGSPAAMLWVPDP